MANREVTHPEDRDVEHGGAREPRRTERRILGFPALEFLQTVFDGLLLISAFAGSMWVYQQLEITREQIAASQDAAIGQQRATNRALHAADLQAEAMTQSIGPAIKTTASAAEASAATSARLAELNEASIEDARASLRLDQRARVGISGIRGEVVSGAPLRFVVMVRNTGKTPAVQFSGFAGVRLLPSAETPKIMSQAATPSRFPKSSAVLAPAGEITMPAAILDSFGHETALPEDVARQIKADPPTLRLYVIGRMTYRDVFKSRHWTEFCLMYSPILGPEAFIVCDVGNHTDDEDR